MAHDDPQELRTARPVASQPPLVCLGPAVRPIVARVVAAVVLAGLLTLLAVAGRLTPAPGGNGTHTQLGLPRCSFLLNTDKPCPTCGMTTAFAYMVRGRVLRALAAQPFGAILCVAVMAAVPASLVVLLTGRGWRVDWYRVTPDRLLWVVLAVFLASWGYTVWAAG